MLILLRLLVDLVKVLLFLLQLAFDFINLRVGDFLLLALHKFVVRLVIERVLVR